MIKTAVIMAAGLGTRFGKYTEMVPKGFVEVSGMSMIERSVKTLLSCGIEKIIIGTGYHKEAYEALTEKYPIIETCFSPRYAETNSMYTLYNTRDCIGKEDFLLLESDLIFDRNCILSLMNSPEPTVLLASPVVKFQDQYYVECDENHVLTNCSVNKEELSPIGEFVGIHKLSNDFYVKMCKDYESFVDEKPKLGYEYELLRMSQEISPVHVLCNPDIKWYEIDDESDMKYAEEHVAPYCKVEE